MEEDYSGFLGELGGYEKVCPLAIGKSGHEYRLPTESEWEYGAGGGIDAAKFWQASDGTVCDYGNFIGQNQCDDGYKTAAPVGSYTANAFGLHDMLGNVAEWVEDCWYMDYDWAHSDGSANIRSSECFKAKPLKEYTDYDCSLRVNRGGHWGSNFEEAPAASRVGLEKDRKSEYIGFRIVRDLE